MATLLKTVPAGFTQTTGEAFAAFLDRTEKLMNALCAQAKTLPEGQIEGAVIKFQVADNYAYYLVAKAKPLQLQHIPYCDGYTVHAALIRGLRHEDVLTMVNRERAFARLFAEREKLAPAKSE